MPKRKTNRLARSAASSPSHCPTCHPVAGSHIVSLLLVAVFSLSAVLITALVASSEQQQVIAAQSALLEQLDGATDGEAAP